MDGDSQEYIDNPDGKRPKQKRTQACVSCRKQKMKCQFSQKSDPPQCDRCRQSNSECRFEVRANDKQWTASVEDRLRRLEDGFQTLLDRLQDPNSWGSPIAEGVWANPRVTVATSTTADDYSSANNGDGSHRQEKRPANKDMASGILSGIIGRPQDDTSSVQQQDEERPTKKQRIKGSNTHNDLISKGIITMGEAQECIEFFNIKLARYLPILVFKYMPQFDIAVRERSPVLFISILTVASLYLPHYQNQHATFRKEFELVADSLEEDGSDISQTVDTILALSLAGAWLGGELGFRMSLKASNIAGTVFPDVQNSLNPDQIAKKEMISAIGLMTYIIEQRLRVIHARPVDPSQLVNGKRRDVFFAQFLASQMSHRKGHHEMDVAELKITANVELCAIILMLQLDLYKEIKLDVINHWNNQLDKWLSEWMGKLTVNLLPSSWKPVILTFHFAKLFLNSLAVSNVKQTGDHSWQDPIDDKMDSATRIQITKAAENSALDIVDMLIRDKDIERLISVGPVFYPTIFITAGALLLKLVSISKSINYLMDEEKILRMTRQAHAVLSSKIASSVLPCYPSVKNLERGIDKISEQSGQSSFDSQNIQQQPQHIGDQRPLQQDQPHVQQQYQQQQDQSNRVIANATSTSSMYPPVQFTNQDHTLPVQNFWSFTPFRSRADYEQLPLDIDTSTTPSSTTDITGVGGLQTIWQNGSNVADFMMDAYSTSLLDSLGYSNNTAAGGAGATSGVDGPTTRDGAVTRPQYPANGDHQ